MQPISLLSEVLADLNDVHGSTDAPFHGGNTGSILVGRANDFKELAKIIL
jgi:hypothetical protein